MKVLNPNTKAHDKIDKIWFQLFEVLDKLCKMQLIICPSSDIHREESSLSPYYDSIKRMYDLLSGGIKFTNELNLKIQQVISSLRLFLDSKQFSNDILENDLAFHQDIHVWQDRIFLTVEFNATEEEIERARKLRDEVSEGFNVIFVKWQQSKKTFKEFYETEEKASTEIVLNDYVAFLKKQISISDNEKVNNLFDSILSPSIILFNAVHSEVRKKYTDALESLKVTFDFFNSDNFRSIPSHKISSYMFAGIARKASQGQKRAPSKGMLNDINIISNYLPFCDAMFLDNECVALLKENPAGDYINIFKSGLYSKNAMDGFFEYLENIENSASPKHINKLKEVYGDGWNKPYTSLYETK